MDLKSQFDTQSDWEVYRGTIRKAFREVLVDPSNYKDNITFKKLKEMQYIIGSIDHRFTEISQLKVKIRQDHKELHQEYIDKFYTEINELIDALNENFVLEILLGD